jgi:hypothetical protein
VESALTLNVAKGSVRRWLKHGLPHISEQRPFVILKGDLIDFLDQRKPKQRCEPNELYCFRCRAPKAAGGGARRSDARCSGANSTTVPFETSRSTYPWQNTRTIGSRRHDHPRNIRLYRYSRIRHAIYDTVGLSDWTRRTSKQAYTLSRPEAGFLRDASDLTRPRCHAALA